MCKQVRMFEPYPLCINARDINARDPCGKIVIRSSLPPSPQNVAFQPTTSAVQQQSSATAPVETNTWKQLRLLPYDDQRGQVENFDALAKFAKAFVKSGRIIPDFKSELPDNHERRALESLVKDTFQLPRQQVLDLIRTMGPLERGALYHIYRMFDVETVWGPETFVSAGVLDRERLQTMSKETKAFVHNVANAREIMRHRDIQDLSELEVDDQEALLHAIGQCIDDTLGLHKGKFALWAATPVDLAPENATDFRDAETQFQGISSGIVVYPRAMKVALPVLLCTLWHEATHVRQNTGQSSMWSFIPGVQFDPLDRLSGEEKSASSYYDVITCLARRHPGTSQYQYMAEKEHEREAFAAEAIAAVYMAHSSLFNPDGKGILKNIEPDNSDWIERGDNPLDLVQAEVEKHIGTSVQEIVAASGGGFCTPHVAVPQHAHSGSIRPRDYISSAELLAHERRGAELHRHILTSRLNTAKEKLTINRQQVVEKNRDDLCDAAFQALHQMTQFADDPQDIVLNGIWNAAPDYFWADNEESRFIQRVIQCAVSSSDDRPFLTRVAADTYLFPAERGTFAAQLEEKKKTCASDLSRRILDALATQQPPV